MTNPNLTYIVAVLDRSGSMINKVDDTQGGFDSFIADQRQLADSGIETSVTLVQFDNEYTLVYQNKPIDEVPPLKLVPRGNTALYDAIGKAISSTGRRLRQLPADQRPGSVVMLIMTDGFENASREYTQPMIKTMIERQQDEYSWLFKFFGADITALSVAGSMGIDQGNALYYAGTNTRSAFVAASNSTARYVGATASGLSYGQAVMDSAFTDEERDAAANGK